jgi:hypothetical protein
VSRMEASAPPSNGRYFGGENLEDEWPSPIGLFSGMFAVAVVQVPVPSPNPVEIACVPGRGKSRLRWAVGPAVRDC